MNAYQVLGIGSDADERTIKRAYAALIKQYRPDTHPAEFAQVRAAYEAVLHWLRENQQWQEQQQAEENKAGPVASVEEKPGIQTVEPATAVEDAIEQPAAVERSLIVEQLNQLEEIAMQGNEQAILAKYREQSARMAMETLDQQLEYEQALLYWVLATQHPSLLLFAEANKRYDWVSDSIAICRRYGDYAGYRLAAMDSLLKTFEEAKRQKNPHINIEGEQKSKQHWLVDHYSIQYAEQICSNWDRDCIQAGVEKFRGYLNLDHGRDIQVYWLDLLIGLAAAGIAWVLMWKPKNIAAWQWSLMVGLAFAVLPAVTKLARRWIQTRTKFGKKGEAGQLGIKLYLFVTVVIVFSAAGGGGGPSIIMALFIMATPFIAAAIYEFLAEQEVKVVRNLKRLVQLISWIKMAVLALEREKLRLFKFDKGDELQHASSTVEPSLEQIKAQFIAGLNVSKQVILAYMRALPWWGWIIIIWFSFTAILNVLKN